jgi:signal transduction histidine kinase
MVLMVVVALVLAGAVAFVVTIHAARVDTRRELVREAAGLAVAVQSEAEVSRPGDPAASLRTIIRALKAPLRLQDAAVLAVAPDGSLFDPVNILQPPRLPTGLNRSDLDPSALLDLRTVSGQTDGLVYAAVPYRTSVRIGAVNRRILQVVVLTRRPPTGLAAAGPWFLGAALVIILAAVIVADRLGRRFMRPVRAIQTTTGRIAAGDLDARVPHPPGVDPELAALASSVNAMADSLARSRSVERLFLLSVSHDLRTPLTSIRGFAEAIEDGVTTDTTKAAGIIAAEARRLERLVGDLLDLSKLETRSFSLELGAVNLAEVVDATAGGFGPAAGELGLALAVVADPSTPLPVVADPDRLAQVVANLLENALSFAHSAVRVGATMSNGSPVLWVDDDGPGISAADLPRVFERLYSSRPESGRTVGSGLGLAIVGELVAAMGGTVRAESPLLGAGGGTRMVVTLCSLPDPGQRL